MKALKHICLMGLMSLMGVLFTACKNYGEAAYITEPTDIALTVLSDHITAGSAQVLIEPMDDRAYYFTRAVPANEYIPGTMDRDFMMLVMDSVYIHYLLWRYDLLRAGETYIAPFSSHSLKYGVQTIHVDTLAPDTKYMIYAFCVNPVNLQPMGDLYCEYFQTTSITDIHLTFQLELEDEAVYIMPSDDETNYLAAIIDKDMFVKDYNESVIHYFNSQIEDWKEYGLLDWFMKEFLHKNAYRFLYYFTPGNYVVLLAPYDGGISPNTTVCEIEVDSAGVATLIEPLTPVTSPATSETHEP